ncbi:hypothetical protein [Streptomyces sp. NPDC001601]|uniref:DUF2201 family putative metallopeptidase n=1 Tax=Streptomyces sp. NPDC001601 TaxID=3364592 RepID=UPI00369CDCB1
MSYGERGRPRPPVVGLTDLRALEAYRPADPEVVARARRLKEAALLDFGLTESTVASWLYSKCPHQIPTTAVDTAAVVASGDGTCLLLYNPDFFVGLGLDGVKFVLFHEARHLVHRHLLAGPELREDPVFAVAAEVAVNHVALIRLGRTELPVLDGRPTGVDPRAVYDAYRDDLTAHGLEPLTYDAFTETDLRIYGELKRMREPPVPPPLCPHLVQGLVPADQATVDEVTSSALLNTLLAARRGHAGAERELVDGERLRLAEPGPDGRPGQNRTAEILDRIAASVGVANPATVADPVRQVVRAALRNRWTVLLQGPPGCGKTELVRETLRDGLGRDALYFSLPVTNVEDLCAPVPSPDGTLDNLLAAPFTGPEPKAIVWDEYNRPKDRAAFAKLMEVTQEWSLAGQRIENLRAQIAVQNPPYHLGRKLLVARNNIAQATRFTASLLVEPEDIPANEWLLARYGRDAETVLEWWKHDIDDEGRAWITKRTLERLVRLHRKGLPLEMATVYLGDGEYAPVPLTALVDRFKGHSVTGLRELARDVDAWEDRLRRAAAHSGEGGDDSDVVHQILANAELSQLKRHRAAVSRLVALLPAKLRATYLVGASERQQRYWTEAFTDLRRS